MEKYTIKLYEKQHYALWNNFISEAKNATFLFHRDFMEYHKDRFEDYSLLIFNEKQELVGVIAAHKVNNAVFSHNGLTYGGLLLKPKAKLIQALGMFKALLQFLNEKDIETLHIKEIPSFYCSDFSDELKYLLFLTNAKITRVDSLSTINLQKPYFITKTRRESVHRGKKNNLVIKEEIAFELFWNEILIPNLNKKHQAQPVHTAYEIKLLQQRFPNNIRHFNVYHNDRIVAGTTIFINNNVVHPQYVSGNAQKNELGSLDFLYHYLITNVFKDKEFFDFGISNEEGGTKLNSGLLFWKESFGAKTVAQQFYEVATKNYVLLDSVLL